MTLPAVTADVEAALATVRCVRPPHGGAENSSKWGAPRERTPARHDQHPRHFHAAAITRPGEEGLAMTASIPGLKRFAKR